MHARVETVIGEVRDTPNSSGDGRYHSSSPGPPTPISRSEIASSPLGHTLEASKYVHCNNVLELTLL